jgi:modification methylase
MTDGIHGPDPDVLGRPVASVWAAGRLSMAEQLGGHYHPRIRADHDAMPPAVAAHALVRYSRRGDLVLDPDCGAGTTVVEALRCGRHAVGVTADTRLWEIARTTITTIKRAGAVGDGMMLDGRLRRLSGPFGAGLAGRVDLLLTTVRSQHSVATRAGHRRNHRSTDPVDNLAVALAHCVPLLRPGGYAVITARPQRRDGELVDLPGQIVAAGRVAGLVAVQRCVAVVGDLRGSGVATRAGFAERQAAARACAAGTPTALIAHHDVIVLQAPDHAEQPAAGTAPARTAPTQPTAAVSTHAAPARAQDDGIERGWAA